MSAAAYDQHPNQTAWSNNTSRDVKFRIRIGPRQVRAGNPAAGIPPHTVHPGYEDYIIKPGQTQFLPSKYDHAIQELKDGIVVAGLAPQLTRNGDAPVLHEALDTTHQASKAALAASEAALA